MPFTHLKRGYSWKPPQKKPLLASQVTRVCLPPCPEAPGGRTELSIFAHKSFSLLTPVWTHGQGPAPPSEAGAVLGRAAELGRAAPGPPRVPDTLSGLREVCWMSKNEAKWRREEGIHWGLDLRIPDWLRDKEVPGLSQDRSSTVGAERLQP